MAEDASVQASIIAEVESVRRTAKMRIQETEAAIQVEKERAIQARLEKLKKQNERSIEASFGPDYHVNYLVRQPIYTYQQVEELFGIKIAGFGRGINRTASTVVLISSIEKKKTGFVYHDHWTVNGDYIYSGEGKIGDQSMTLGNKALVDAAHDGKKIYLLVKFSPQEYYYQGIFTLVDYTYEDDQDESGKIRKEYKFRLRRCTDCV